MKIFKVVSINLDISEPIITCNYWTNFDAAWDYISADAREKQRTEVTPDVYGLASQYLGKSLEWTHAHTKPAIYYRSHYGNYRCALYIQEIHVYEEYPVK